MRHDLEALLLNSTEERPRRHERKQYNTLHLGNAENVPERSLANITELEKKGKICLQSYCMHGLASLAQPLHRLNGTLFPSKTRVAFSTFPFPPTTTLPRAHAPKSLVVVSAGWGEREEGRERGVRVRGRSLPASRPATAHSSLRAGWMDGWPLKAAFSKSDVTIHKRRRKLDGQKRRKNFARERERKGERPK